MEDNGQRSGSDQDKDPLESTDPLNVAMIGTQTDAESSRESIKSEDLKWVEYDNEPFPSRSEYGSVYSTLFDTVSDLDLSNWDLEADDTEEPPAKRAKADNATR